MYKAKAQVVTETAWQEDQVNEVGSCVLPGVDVAGAIAVGMSGDLTATEQSFFIAGFQECIKYLMWEIDNDRQ